MRTRRKRYSDEFKREALKRASEEGMTDIQVSEEPVRCRERLGGILNYYYRKAA